MNKYKSKLKLEQYIEYLDDQENLELLMNKKQKIFYGLYNEPDIKKITSAIDNLISWSHWDKSYRYYMSEKISVINDYVNVNNFYWDVIAYFEEYYVIKYGNVSLFVVKDFLELIEVDTYTNYTPNQVKQLLLNNDYNLDSFVPSELSQLSINEVKNKQKSVSSKIDQLKEEMENVKNNKNNELAKLQEEIDKKMEILRNKKEVMMNELNKQLQEFNEKLNNLKNQIYMLKTEIYSIRCFAGETIELLQIRNGKTESIETPVVLNQKILYLDEDLAKTMSIYFITLEHNYKILEEVIKYNDDVLNMFCPQPKSISFFKVSKSNNSYFHNDVDNILESTKLLHGNKMGFVVRNGENVYIGWLEEEWDNDKTDRDSHILSFYDSVIYKPEIKEYNDNEPILEKPTAIEHMVSRIFAISVLQGLIEHKEILNLPKDVKIGEQSNYVIHNYADGWIEDNRYGDFGTLVKNLHHYNKVNDDILLVTNLREAGQENYRATRSKGELNTTRDCKVESGINRINLINDNRIFISAKKEDWGWLERKNNANFEITEDEFINLTFMNSEWIKYYINTKKIGKFGSSKNQNGFWSTLEYSYLIKYFNVAYKYLLKREENEKEIISKYIDNLDKYDWLNLLSHWKIINNVRNMTEFNAKRFAIYLLGKNYYKVKHLFKDEFNIIKENINSEYFTTSVKGLTRKCKYCPLSEPIHKYGWDYEYADLTFTEESGIEEIIEREQLDNEKLKLLRLTVFKYAKDNNVDIYNDKYFKKIFNKFKSKLDNEYEDLINDYILKNIINNECLYNEEIVSKYFNKINSYYYNRNRKIPEKLYHLNYIVLLQEYIYPHIMECIYETRKYNFYHETEKI